MQKNGLIRNMVDFKIYDVTDWTTNNYIHILPNISRSKGNHTRKFGQLVEYTTSNIFPEKSYSNGGGEASYRPFYKKLRLSISMDQHSLKCFEVCLCCMFKSNSIKIY